MIDRSVSAFLAQNSHEVLSGKATVDDVLEARDVQFHGMSLDERERTLSGMTAAERAIFTSTLRQYSPAIDGKAKPIRIANGTVVLEFDSSPPLEFIDWAPDFLNAEDKEILYLVNELIPPGVCCLWHGEPRTRKTWAAIEIVVAFVTGTPAFGLQRFAVLSPGKALYLSQEDGARLVRIRFKAVLRALGIMEWPKNLGFAVHKGIDLESAEWQNLLIEAVKRHGIRLVVFDPIRRFAVNADKGPTEVRAITAFLRRLCTETGCAVLIIHHDVKPQANGQDNRRRGHRASGGDWFAASECPVSFEVAGDSQTVAYPESFKLSTDPEPFTFTLKTDDPRNPTTAQLIGETTTSGEAATFAIDEAVLAYLQANRAGSGRSIARAMHKAYEAVTASLERLLEADKVDCADFGKGRGKSWTVR